MKNTVYGLITFFVIAFLTGFLQDTEFEFVIYVSYFILLVAGVNLIALTRKSKATGILKGLLLLAGFSSTIYFSFFAIAAMDNLLSGVGITEFMESVEDILYLVSLFLLIGTIGSIVLLQTSKE